MREATNKPPTTRVSFHPYCIGDEDTATYLTWESTAVKALEAAAGSEHGGRVKILKMDIEGWEWVVLPEVLKLAGVVGKERLLPQQVAVEVHLATHARYKVPGFTNEKSIAVLPSGPRRLHELRVAMESAGYTLVDRNDNPFCGHCSELLFAMV